MAMTESPYQTLNYGRDQFGFRKVELFKEQGLGTGSYGGVCKARCDGVICAAKIMHPTLFDLRDPGTVSYLRKFEQECHLLGSVRHPNVVQYLGTYCDPITHLPVLLMELCDESLSRLLERSPQPLPYHIQVNVAHDISLALSYLHLNSLTHRDLTGNNVLMIAGVRAKLTDFGMSRLFRTNPRISPMTLCPGNMQYMSPEALDEPPSYTDKLDVFSFGVLLVQIATRKFPDPGPRFKVISVPGYPEGSVRVAIPETQRRSSHLHLIPDSHSLKTVAVSCLKDKEKERPSAQELGEVLSELKQAPEYMESLDLVVVAENREGRTEGSEEVANQQAEQTEKDEEIMQLRVAVSEKEREIVRLQTERDRLEAQVEEMRQQLQNTEKAESQKDVPRETETFSKVQNMTWKEERNAPEKMLRGSAVVQGDTLFISPNNSKKIYVCKIFQHGQTWSKLPDNIYFNPSLAVVKDVLVSIGGQGLFDCTNSILSLTRKGLAGKKVFPNMPTPRCDTVSVTTESSLIVAGGYNGKRFLDTVEMMDKSTEVWATACSLPQPFGELSATVCGDRLYMGGGYNGMGESSRSVLTCCLSSLLSSRGKGGGAVGGEKAVWEEIQELPLTLSSLVTLDGRLLAIGGADDSETDSTAVHCYDSVKNTWCPVSNLLSPRNQCLVGVVPGDRVLVVGGWQSVSVEIGTLSPILATP